MLEGQTLPGRGRLADYSNLVRLPHTVFALPFAVVGLVMASYRFPVHLGDVFWILLAFTSARFAAMGFNRVVDRGFDARNPRTEGRELPSGKLSAREAGVAVVAAGGVFVLSAGMLNPLCLALSPLALGWVLLYSYTKRFTPWAHLVLGAALAIAPVGGYLAVTGEWSDPASALLLLAVAVASWVAGFDVLYSLQDVDFDRHEGLHSFPAAFGAKGAILASRLLHALSVAGFLALGFVVPEFGGLFFAGVALVAAMLWYEQSLVSADDLSRLDAAFFTVNGVISILFLGFVLVERLLV
ncbi:MAG: UbiA-like polyprenyltransferase [Longimicrobiaceae bacterium]